MAELDLNDLEQKVLECLDEDRDLADWWEGVRQLFADIQLTQFCSTVKSLADKELVVLGEGVPDPYFGRPEHFEPDERVEVDQLPSLVDAFETEAGFGDDFEF